VSPSCRPLALAACALLVALAPAGAAAPTLTYLSPAGARRGTTVEVTAGGAFAHWPVRAWASGAGVSVTAGKEKGKLSVTVAPDAAPGTYWVRLHDQEGASAARPFLVGTLPEVVEQEPNDDPTRPQVLPEARVVVNGRLGERGDVDGFAVPLRKGQTLVASLEANQTLGSPMDAVLQVVSEKGFVLAESNDERGLDPQLAFAAPTDGRYVVRTFAFPGTPDASVQFAGGEQFVYRLTLTTAGFADHAFPLAISRAAPGRVELVGWNLPAAAKAVPVTPGDGPEAMAFHPEVANTPPITVSGRLDPGGVDVFTFEAKKGEQFLFQVESRSLGSPLDAVLRLTDAAGKELARVDDTGNRRDPELSFKAPRDGAYRVEVSDLHSEGGPRYAYRLRALRPGPDYDLTLKDDRFALTPGKPLELPVTVGRRQGFAEPVEVSAEGLPPGVTAAPVRSTAGGASAAAVVLRLTAVGGATSGPFRVVGRVAGKEGLTRQARPAPAAAGAVPAWLTVAAPPKAK
jgi:hypothetical protein